LILIDTNVLPIDEDVLDRARTLLDQHAALSARDALHAACCLLRAAPLCSYDRDFDGIDGLRRVEPKEVR
jgi:predicted nucleic acid-binding protein